MNSIHLKDFSYERVKKDFAYMIPDEDPTFNKIKSVVGLRDYYWVNMKKIIKKVDENSKLSLKQLQCVYRNLFPNLPILLYSWKNNSCFIDVIIFFIFNSVNPFWKNKITKGVNDMKYKKLNELMKEMRLTNICINLRNELYKLGMVNSISSFGESQDLYSKLAQIYDFSYKVDADGKEYSYDFVSTEKVIPKGPVLVLYTSGLTKSVIKDQVKYYQFYGYQIIGRVVHTGNHFVIEMEIYEGRVLYNDLSKNLSYIDSYSVGNSDIIFMEKIKK